MRIVTGGFNLDNIKKWIVEEMDKSGDPRNFFYAMMDAAYEIEDEGILQDDESLPGKKEERR